MNLDDSQLLGLAGDGAFERGVSYAQRGRVRIEESAPERLRASVAGTQRYRVRLDSSAGEIDWHCDCPAAANGDFCKHLVATVIAARESKSVAAPADIGQPGLRGFLRAQPAERLADWLVELAETDSSIEQRLRLRQSQTDPRALKKALGSLLRARGFLDWRAAQSFARNLDSAVESLAEACAAMPEHGRELCEYALAKLFERYGESEDSSGAIGDRVQALADLYRRTLAQRAGVDDAAQGRRLLDLQRRDDWSFLELDEFWPLLGPRAQQAYAAAVEAEFAALPETADPNDRSRWSRELSVVHRMEQLAAARGDVDLLIRVIARDLSSGHAYLRIVEVCRDAGRDREATLWAQRGYRQHPDWRGMRALLAEQYQHDGLDTEALELYWDDFRAEPTPAAWHRLKQSASQRWAEYRERALAHVEQAEVSIADGRPDVSERVELLLADGDVDSARQLGERHAVRFRLLEALADAVAQTHPAAAAGFLRRVVDATLPKLDARTYWAAVEQIAQARRLKPDAETDSWIEALRARYRARRKFIALLDERLARTA